MEPPSNARLYLYEIHFEKDGQERDMIFTADARSYDDDAQEERTARGQRR